MTTSLNLLLLGLGTPVATAIYIHTHTYTLCMHAGSSVTQYLNAKYKICDFTRNLHNYS